MGLHYIGDGAHIPNVPARDLSEKEAEKYGEEIEAERKFTGRRLYEPLKSEPAKSADTASKGGDTKPRKE